MEKINANVFENSVISTNNDKKTDKGKSYLLKEPIEDSFSSGGNTVNKKGAKKTGTVVSKQTKIDKEKNNNKTLMWILGGLAATGAFVLAVRSHNTKVSKNSFETISQEREKGAEEFRRQYNGGASKSTSHSEASRSTNRGGGSASTEKFETYAEKQQKEINKIAKDFNNAVNGKLIEQLKNDITKELGTGTKLDFENPSTIVDEHIKVCLFDKSESLLTNMYALIKKRLPNIKDPVEVEKSKQCSLYLLGELHFKVDYNKGKVIEKEAEMEAGDLLDSYFGKGSISSKVRNKIKNDCHYSSYCQAPSQMFSQVLNYAAESYLQDVLKNHADLVNKTVSEEGLNLIKTAKILNKKAMESLDKINATKGAYSRTSFGYTQKTAENYEKGKFKTGQDDFWDSYWEEFNKKYKDNKYKRSENEGSKSYSNSESKGSGSKESNGSGNNDYSSNYRSEYEAKDAFINDESLKIFKKYGEDLGDLNKLDEKSLKSAFRKLTIKYHPDRNNGDDKAFKEILNAYEALKKKL